MLLLCDRSLMDINKCMDALKQSCEEFVMLACFFHPCSVSMCNYMCAHGCDELCLLLHCVWFPFSCLQVFSCSKFLRVLLHLPVPCSKPVTPG